MAITTIQKGQTDWHIPLNANFVDLDGNKLRLESLWTGNWGASGSAPITISGLANYAVFALYMRGGLYFFSGVNVTINPIDKFLSADGATVTEHLRLITKAGITLTLTSARMSTNGGAWANSNSNSIAAVYGVKN